MSYLQPNLNPDILRNMKIPLHREQLNFMIELAQSRPEFLNPFFRFLAYFDSPYFFFVLIPIIWLGYSYKWGLRIFYWFTLSNFFNSYLKYLVGWPRPSTDLPAIGMQHPLSNGFPSGGAQTCMFLGVIFIYYWRTPASWVVGSIYILLISFSRLYLGVHYPIDVLGGWVFGLALAGLMIKAKPHIEKYLMEKGLNFSLFLGFAIPILIMAISQSTQLNYVMGAAIGVNIGAHFSLKHHLFLPKPKNLIEATLRSLFGIATIFALVLFLGKEGTFAQSFYVGLFMSVAISPIWRELKRVM